MNVCAPWGLSSRMALRSVSRYRLSSSVLMVVKRLVNTLLMFLSTLCKATSTPWRDVWSRKPCRPRISGGTGRRKSQIYIIANVLQYCITQHETYQEEPGNLELFFMDVLSTAEKWYKVWFRKAQQIQISANIWQKTHFLGSTAQNIFWRNHYRSLTPQTQRV